MATKRNVKVTVYTLAQGDPLVFDDAQNAGSGTSAATALESYEMIKAKAASGKLAYVPFHAVGTAFIESTISEVDDPADDTCVTEDGGDNGDSGNEGN